VKISIGTRIALSVGTAALLAGCAGSAVSSGAPATVSAAAKRGGASWMAPNASSQDLLYVTGACGGICVFSYPGNALVGELADSNTPFGECVDKAGDVFVVNFGGEGGSAGIVEYAHGGTSPLATLSDPGYNPQSCSVDPTTGNLAVTNESGENGTTGGVAIYANAQGEPTDYVDPKIFYMSFCAYDDKGNLFVDGQYDHKGTFQFDELPKGSSNFKTIKLDQSPSFPLNLQWAGKYIALADSQTVIYHVAVSGSKGSVVGSTVLNGPVSIIEVQFWIQGGTIVAPYGKGDSPHRIGYWQYPTGGRVRKHIGGPQFDDSELFGTVVSLAHK
jgi:hypothetical protein